MLNVFEFRKGKSIAAAAAAANSAAAVGFLAGKPNMLTLRSADGIAIRPHGVIGKSFALVRFHMHAAASKQQCETAEKLNVFCFHGLSFKSDSISSTYFFFVCSPSNPLCLKRTLPSVSRRKEVGIASAPTTSTSLCSASRTTAKVTA